ncbi:hypothetical protein K469DRAFT_271607 [Zopfia rhizophila CBS 207.26]|uniref:Uncharacterized protein n=1 Tax=Zopfia rhizophila CBS 207.26 TaxID=1314779 RepID=A0A6A6DN94_9PEZI|nr:hypothetical protein K469DRAFT_271607 [Zopfia rhizophila CBS 207.26]
MPRLDELPGILEQSNNLARISRYLSRLEEFISFFLSVQELLQPDELRSPSHDAAPYCSNHVKKRAKFEAERARQKVFHEQNLCKSYIAPFDNLIQMMISYSTTQITSRLDSGRRVAEQFAKIGIILAAITGIVSPLSLITSFYGMNVKEFTPEAVATLYGFWTVGLPVLLFSLVLGVFLGLWLFAEPRKI